MWKEAGQRLEGRLVVLEPLAPAHVENLTRAASDPAIWRCMHTDGSTPEGVRAWLDAAFGAAGAGAEFPFVTVSVETGELLGSTRYLSLAPEHRRLEIGHTWLVPSAWGTGVNAEAKLLLLGRAFDELGCLRVEFKTDASNERSRAALAALPAQFEGVHRKHMLVRGEAIGYAGAAGVTSSAASQAMPRRRDSAWYSITDDEWPAVRENLRRRLSER